MIIIAEALITGISFHQSLIIPFTYLINNQRDTVLSMLESTDVNGRSGLDVFIQTWCENAETFQGFWPSRISTIAFTQLYTAERPSLQNLMVKGDMIVNPETRNSECGFLCLSLLVYLLYVRFSLAYEFHDSHHDAFTNESEYASHACSE
jgi:hypothetical protein